MGAAAGVTPVPAIRAAVPADAAALARCHVACWRETYASVLSAGLLAGLDEAEFRGRWEQHLAGPQAGVLVGVVTGELAGFVRRGPSRDAPPVRDLELLALYTRAVHHGSGLGQALLEASVGDAPCALWVARDNPRARAFYARNGFRPDGASKVDDALEGLVEVRLVR